MYFKKKNVLNFQTKGLTYKWRLRSETASRQVFDVRFGDSPKQCVSMNIRYSKSDINAHVKIVLIGSHSRINYFLMEDLQKVIEQRGPFGMAIAIFRNGRRVM